MFLNVLRRPRRFVPRVPRWRDEDMSNCWHDILRQRDRKPWKIRKLSSAAIYLGTGKSEQVDHNLFLCDLTRSGATRQELHIHDNVPECLRSSLDSIVTLFIRLFRFWLKFYDFSQRQEKAWSLRKVHRFVCWGLIQNGINSRKSVNIFKRVLIKVNQKGNIFYEVVQKLENAFGTFWFG